MAKTAPHSRSATSFSSPQDASHTPHGPVAPGWSLLAMEFRAPWELGSVLPAWPVLQRAPRGDGHTVIVYPGLSAHDLTTLPLRKYLDTLGYTTHGWSQGFNLGPRHGVLERGKDQLRELIARSTAQISLVGWSLGGIYARELAKEIMLETTGKSQHAPIRSVVTLGTPFAGHPRSTNAWRIYELATGRQAQREAEKYDLRTAPPVPTTSIYSRTDGVVAWQASVQAAQANNPHTENIEVQASHFGIGMNPSAWWAVADRLAQAPKQWQPFKKPSLLGLQGLVYPDPSRA
jgi:extradiol dioxygenase family protein